MSRTPTHRSAEGSTLDAAIGRADLHIHTMASDGTDGVQRIIELVEAAGDLDVVGIADHERVDAALAGRALARARGLRVEVVVGEEVTTRGGHLLALFIEERVRPWRSMRTTIGEIHEQGGLAIPAHPLFPYPLCAQSWTLRGLLRLGDPMVRPDAIEAFNPTTFGRWVHGRVVAFARETGLPTIGSSDAHEAAAIGMGSTTFPGRTAEDLRTAIRAGTTGWEGSFHGTVGQLPTFGRQLRKYGRDARDGLGGKLRRDGTGRDLGFPGGRLRPARLVLEEEAGDRDGAPPPAPGAVPAGGRAAEPRR